MSAAELRNLPPGTEIYLHDGVRLSRKCRVKLVGRIKSRVVTTDGKEILVKNTRLKPCLNY